MLRRVVVENYIIFKGRQELDLESACGSSFHTLVGENSSGKSSFVALVKAASNFVDNDEDFEVIGNNVVSAKAVCEFHFKHGRELSQYFESSPSNLTGAVLSTVPCVSGLFSWFSDDVLKFPTELTYLLRETFGSVSGLVRVFSGRKTFNSSNPSHCQFLYVVCKDVVLVVIKNNGELSAALHDPLPAGVDPMEWCPDEAFLRKLELNIQNESPMIPAESSSDIDVLETEHSDLAHSGWDTLRYRDVKNLIMVSLLKNLPRERIDEALVLFHEIMGDQSLAFELDLDGDIPLRILDKGTHRIIQRVSEGTFSTFVVAALVVNPFSRTIIFDEVARGMHPLQVRRLRTILMRESRSRRKCIITTTHSPEVVEVERINLIWRFQVLPSGYCQIRRVRSHYNVRDLHFIGGAEVREIFFARYIVWVEGESDKRFLEALLRLFDEGNPELLKLLLEPGSAATMTGDSHASLPESSQSCGPDLPEAVENLLQDPAYQRRCYTKELLAKIQEAVRSCIVLSISGKKNVYKATAICNDLGIPYAVVCDLDVIIPNSKENSVQSQFNNCHGLWTSATIPHAKSKLLDEEQCPASKCVQDFNPELIPKLRACKTVGDVMKFYDRTQRIFTWRVDGGEIEDAVRLTKSQFGKKLWPDLSFGDIKELVVCLLQPRKLRERNPKDKDASKQPNPELLRCIFFLIHFLRESLKAN